MFPSNNNINIPPPTYNNIFEMVQDDVQIMPHGHSSVLVVKPCQRPIREVCILGDPLLSSASLEAQKISQFCDARKNNGAVSKGAA